MTTNKTSLSQQQEPAAGTLVVFDQTLQIRDCRNLATCFLLDRIWISISIYVELTVNICQVDIVNIDNTKYETATTQATCFRSSSTAVLLLEQKKRKTIQTKLSQKKRRKISLKKIAYNVLYLLAPPSPLQSVNALIRHCPSTIWWSHDDAWGWLFVLLIFPNHHDCGLPLFKTSQQGRDSCECRQSFWNFSCFKNKNMIF